VLRTWLQAYPFLARRLELLRQGRGPGGGGLNRAAHCRILHPLSGLLLLPERSYFRWRSVSSLGGFCGTITDGNRAPGISAKIERFLAAWNLARWTCA
jgi:hypothetical protein